MNCQPNHHRTRRRAVVPRPCLLPTSGRIAGGPRIFRSDRIDLMRSLRQRPQQPSAKSTFSGPYAMAHFLAEWERDTNQPNAPGTVIVFQWEPGLLVIVTAGSPERVERQLAEPGGFGDLILAVHQTQDGTAGCIVLGATMSNGAIREFNRELNRTVAKGGSP